MEQESFHLVAWLREVRCAIKSPKVFRSEENISVKSLHLEEL